MQATELPKNLDHPIAIDLIIGLHVPEALQPLELIAGRDCAPFAARTRLGKTVNDPVRYPNLVQ